MKTDLLNELTSNNIRIQEKAEQFGVTKQTFYNFIKYYDNGELAKIPDVVRNYFGMVMDEEMTIEDAEKYWASELQHIMAIEAKLPFLENRLELIKNKLNSSGDGLSGIYEIDDPAVRNTLITEQLNLEKVIENENKVLKSLRETLSRKTNPNETDDNVDVSFNKILLRSPRWDVSESFLESYALNDSGHYTIFYNHDQTPAKADIYAALGGKMVKIATYRNKDNENFVAFRLSQGLDYFYELTVYSEGGPFKSDILKL